jgi:hypothetical protein
MDLLDTIPWVDFVVEILTFWHPNSAYAQWFSIMSKTTMLICAIALEINFQVYWDDQVDSHEG